MTDAPPTIIVSAAEAAAGLRHGWLPGGHAVAEVWWALSE